MYDVSQELQSLFKHVAKHFTRRDETQTETPSAI